MSDRRISFIGGTTDFEPALSSSDIFDPKTNSFSNGSDMVMERSGAKMSRARWGHVATPISAGRILFTGGLTNTPEEPGRSAGPVRGLEIFVP